MVPGVNGRSGGTVMEFALLGAVEVRVEGQVVDAGHPLQRVVLAVLLADAGRTVAPETLVDRVWGDSPPKGARQSLHAHITRIRRLLTAGGGTRAAGAGLVLRGGGYVLDVDRDRVDLHRFRRLLDEARDPGYPDGRRVLLLRQAMELWRGEPLAGLPGAWAARTRESWLQQYPDAVVAWAHAELAVANPDPVISRVSDLVGELPLAESLTAVLMRALHAAGRPSDALARYATIRQRLADELGADPGPQLQAVHQAILRGAVSSPTGTGTRPASVEQPLPAQLPADVPGFTGREAHLAALDALLTDPSGQPERFPTAVVVSAVSGTAGVGKTALVVHWAHRVAPRFPDGQLYVNLRGFDPTGLVMAPAEAVRGFLEALGVPPERVPATLDAQTALYRSLLAGRRVLVVLDNARDAEQTRPLLPASPTALAVVTSRNQLTGLVAGDGAHPLTLDLLSPVEARDLLTQRLGASRVRAEPDAVDRIITACARLPLALCVAAARARQTGFPLSSIAAELAQAGRRLDALDAGDRATDVRAVFSWSVAALTPPAARLFRQLSLHPGPDITAPAAASLAALTVDVTRRRLTELTRANLLVEHRPGRYTVHDLLRAYATDLSDGTDPEPDRQAATGRLLDHVVHSTHAAGRILDPHRDPAAIPLRPPAPGAGPERFTDHRQATGWLAAEYPVLLATVHHAAASGADTHAWQLAWAVDPHINRRGDWHDLTAVWQAALHAAHRLGDPGAQAYAHRRHAHADSQLGHHDEAAVHLGHAVRLAAEAGDRIGQAHAHRGIAYLSQRQGHTERALEQAGHALSLFRETGHLHGQASVLNTIGWSHAQHGDHTRARAACEQAIALLQKVGDRVGEAATWDSLGHAYHHAGRYTEAVDCYQRSLALLCGLGNDYFEADTLTRLGDAHDADHDTASARTAWARALDLLTAIGHPSADAVRARLDRSSTTTDDR